MASDEDDFEAELDRRLALASQPENMGKDLIFADYALLVLATVVLPAVLLIIGWLL